MLLYVPFSVLPAHHNFDPHRKKRILSVKLHYTSIMFPAIWIHPYFYSKIVEDL
jgi:hypothetical protein